MAPSRVSYNSVFKLGFLYVLGFVVSGCVGLPQVGTGYTTATFSEYPGYVEIDETFADGRSTVLVTTMYLSTTHSLSPTSVTINTDRIVGAMESLESKEGESVTLRPRDAEAWDSWTGEGFDSSNGVVTNPTELDDFFFDEFDTIPPPVTTVTSDGKTLEMLTWYVRTTSTVPSDTQPAPMVTSVIINTSRMMGAVNAVMSTWQGTAVTLASRDMGVAVPTAVQTAVCFSELSLNARNCIDQLNRDCENPESNGMACICGPSGVPGLRNALSSYDGHLAPTDTESIIACSSSLCVSPTALPLSMTSATATLAPRDIEGSVVTPASGDPSIAGTGTTIVNNPVTGTGTSGVAQAGAATVGTDAPIRLPEMTAGAVVTSISINLSRMVGAVDALMSTWTHS